MPLDKGQDITCAFSSDAINIVIIICKIYDFYLFTFYINDLLFWLSCLNYIELYF